MDHIILDESGKLVSGAFYQLNQVPLNDLDEYEDDPDRDDSWIVVRRTPTDAQFEEAGKPNWMYVTVYAETKFVRDCPIDEAHFKQIILEGAEVDFAGGPRVSDFVPDSAFTVVVSAPFKQQLEKSGLTGLKFLPLAPADKEWAAKFGNPQLYQLKTLGWPCERQLKLVGAPNHCPFCKHGPLLCPKCGYRMVYCAKCGELTAINRIMHTGPGDRRLRLSANPKAGPILEGKYWDGSDFFRGGPYFTKRALDWLLSVHAAPFVARPARVCIDGMSDKQLAQLEAAKKPISKDG